VVYSSARIEPILIEYTAGIDQIQPNSVLLPLNLSTIKGERKAFPFLHASDYYTMTNGAINLGNPEPFYDLFPLKYKPNLRLPFSLPGVDCWMCSMDDAGHDLQLCNYTSMIDYLLVWDQTADTYFNDDIARCYDLTFSKGRMNIYVPRLKR
jgi:hypothetical protein